MSCSPALTGLLVLVERDAAILLTDGLIASTGIGRVVTAFVLPAESVTDPTFKETLPVDEEEVPAVKTPL